MIFNNLNIAQLLDQNKLVTNLGLCLQYLAGTSTVYSYDKEKKSIKRHEFELIVGSFSNTYTTTESEMLRFISQQALVDLREAEFEV